MLKKLRSVCNSFRPAAICLWGALLLVAIVLVCNIVVLAVAGGRCYSRVEDVPHCCCGILLSTGRSAAPSPYYTARVQAATELLRNEKIDTLIISGENQYADYNEVDSMAADILAAVPDAVLIYDYQGVDTYASMVNAAKSCGDDNTYLIISQRFHNRRAVFYGSLVFCETPVAFPRQIGMQANAADTHNLWWRTRNLFRECLARTKAVLFALLHAGFREG
ncbi:MAG: ElyC/SanA/YdcF family protein [Paludibacteraceae bacterium]|nr:ElyC/SanA/YdcF family protein [Paludibacteraceae bacterium]